ncbi:hypothetical protein [Erwinia phyllosphaerae]|uniref:hypothetical protein n=1 Tax=Erwinia phyllosphaerae TaxID=2853256 RepID=UPI001FEE4E87|nr:hypothetical protein [Erwinia phyllosphaerae]MBV4365904.1 hypothetical protein [Erwinia phyllosphaerae]
MTDTTATTTTADTSTATTTTVAAPVEVTTPAATTTTTTTVSTNESLLAELKGLLVKLGHDVEAEWDAVVSLAKTRISKTQ